MGVWLRFNVAAWWRFALPECFFYLINVSADSEMYQSPNFRLGAFAYTKTDF